MLNSSGFLVDLRMASIAFLYRLVKFDCILITGVGASLGSSLKQGIKLTQTRNKNRELPIEPGCKVKGRVRVMRSRCFSTRALEKYEAR